MTMFWISATLMVAVALLFFVPALLRGPRTGVKDLGHSAASHRKQLQSLELAFRDGHLNKKDYQSRRKEISEAMMATLRILRTIPPPTAHQVWVSPWPLCCRC